MSAQDDIARVYETFERAARRLYKPIDAEIAAATFAKNCFAGRFFGRGDKWRPPPRMRFMGKMPNPKATAKLGPLHSFAYVVMKNGRPTGEIAWVKPKGTLLLWSPSLRAAVAFPGSKIGPPSESAKKIPRAHAAYRTFHQGKEPWGASWMDQPSPPFGPPHWAISTAYASDKFNDTGRLELYVHMHEPGVMFFDGSNHEGRALCVRGGRLSLESHGLSG